MRSYRLWLRLRSRLRLLLRSYRLWLWSRLWSGLRLRLRSYRLWLRLHLYQRRTVGKAEILAHVILFVALRAFLHESNSRLCLHLRLRSRLWLLYAYKLLAILAAEVNAIVVLTMANGALFHIS